MDRRFGFIHDKLDIKILILYILQRLPRPVSVDTLADLTLCDDGISFFDFAECLAELVSSEHVSEQNGNYAITEKGQINGKITETSLPYSVRIKAERNTAKIAQVQKRNALIKVSHSMRKNGGCTVSLSMSDGFGQLISLDLLTGSQEQAEAFEHAFQKNAEDIYEKIVGIMIDNIQ